VKLKSETEALPIFLTRRKLYIVFFGRSNGDRSKGVRKPKSADEFTKRRLLDLAARYDKRIKAAGPRSPLVFSKCRSMPKAHRHKSEAGFRHGGRKHGERVAPSNPRALISGRVEG
jgi:hypothetical protein